MKAESFHISLLLIALTVWPFSVFPLSLSTTEETETQEAGNTTLAQAWEESVEKNMSRSAMKSPANCTDYCECNPKHREIVDAQLNALERKWEQQTAMLLDAFQPLNATIANITNGVQSTLQNHSLTLEDHEAEMTSFMTEFTDFRNASMHLAWLNEMSMNVTVDRVLMLAKALEKLQQSSILNGAKISSLEKRLNESLQQQLEAKAKLYQLEGKLNDIITQKITANMAPFTNNVTEKVKHILGTFQSRWSGLRPVICDVNGQYADVNWNRLGGNQDWHYNWRQILFGAYGYLYLPPLILPFEMNNWMIELRIGWWSAKNKLVITGSIVETEHNKNCPDSLIVKLQMNLLSGYQIICQEVLTLTLHKYHAVLGNVANQIQRQWQIPVAKVKILP